jgi:RNA recognition motif-containing protein
MSTQTKSGNQPNVVFVGNLSYFCEENHLFELFNQYAHVQHVRVVHNDNNTRSLMFGFVTLATTREALEMERLLNNHLFMGRRMKYVIVIVIAIVVVVILLLVIAAV